MHRWSMRQVWSFLTVVAALATSPGQATIVDGRLTTSAYAFEASPTDSTRVTQLRTHAALRLRITDLGDRRLSLQTYLRATTDLSASAGNDPRLRPISTYLRFKDDILDLRLGRQYVQAGVGYGHVDGMRADLRFGGVRLTLHGGALVPVYGDDGLGSLSDAYLWGLRLSTDRVAGIDLAVSYADRRRDPIAYDQAGTFSGFIGQPEGVRRHLVGIDARRRFGAHSTRARLDYDIENRSLRRAEAGGRIGLISQVTLSADWMRRQPSLYAGSILGVFAGESFDEVTVRLHYQLSTEVALTAHAATVLYDGDDSQRLGLSASFGRYLTLGYNHSQGYAGANDGLSGSLLYPLSPQLMLRGQLGLNSYERVVDADREGLLTGIAALSYRASRALSLDGQLQALRNPSYDSDLRLLLRATWRFRS